MLCVKKINNYYPVLYLHPAAQRTRLWLNTHQQTLNMRCGLWFKTPYLGQAIGPLWTNDDYDTDKVYKPVGFTYLLIHKTYPGM